jgi:hypothetical protein
MPEDALNLTLPPAVPGTPGANPDLAPAALYTLVDLSDAELQELQRVCESEYGEGPSEIYYTPSGTKVRVAPQPRFVGASLQTVWDQHLELREQGVYDPYYFVVAHKKDWGQEGVLLVSMSKWDNIKCNKEGDDIFDCDHEECEAKPDLFRAKATAIGIIIANLQIANMGWEEFKYYSDGRDRLPGLSVYDSADDEAPGDDDSSDSEPDFPDERPPLGFYIPLYVVETVDKQAVLESLGSGPSHPNDNTTTERAIRYQASVATSGTPLSTNKEGIYSRVCTMHPVRCRKDPYLCKEFLLLADSANLESEGLKMVRLYWDRKTGNSSKAMLRKLGFQASHEIQRIPCSKKGIQEWFIPIANDERRWQAAHPLVAVFACSEDARDESIFYPTRQKPALGDEWVMFAPQSIPSEGGTAVGMKWGLDESVRRFPWLCRQNRFRQNLLKEYFILIDSPKAEGDGVLIVRTAWSGYVERKSEKELLEEGMNCPVQTLRVNPKDAVSLIEKGIHNGRRDTELTEEQRKFFGLEFRQQRTRTIGLSKGGARKLGEP